jgi:hypothetical protein
LRRWKTPPHLVENIIGVTEGAKRVIEFLRPREVHIKINLIETVSEDTNSIQGSQ